MDPKSPWSSPADRLIQILMMEAMFDEAWKVLGAESEQAIYVDGLKVKFKAKRSFMKMLAG